MHVDMLSIYVHAERGESARAGAAAATYQVNVHEAGGGKVAVTSLNFTNTSQRFMAQMRVRLHVHSLNRRPAVILLFYCYTSAH